MLLQSVVREVGDRLDAVFPQKRHTEITISEPGLFSFGFFGRGIVSELVFNEKN